MRAVGFWAGLALFSLLLLAPLPDALPGAAQRVAAVAALMGVWWFSEAIPVALTGVLPFLLLPALGVATPEAVAGAYVSPVLFLVLGGTLMGVALERWDLHRRIARLVLSYSATSARSLVSTVLTATALVSMWVNNSAATVMMLPIALALTRVVTMPRESVGPITADGARAFGAAMVLAVAYGSNIGGLATIVGTPVNGVAVGLIERQLGVHIGFLRWMSFGVPLMLLALPVCAWLLTRVVFRFALPDSPRALLLHAIGDPGPWTSAQRRVVGVLLSACAGWLLMPWLAKQLPGVSDAAVAVIGALALCLLPSGEQTEQGTARPLLEWSEAGRAPWYLIILLGGGIALAESVTRSGLGNWLGGELTRFAVLPQLALLPLVVLVIILITECASNIATAAAFIPVAVALANGGGHEPLLFALATGLAASWGFANPAGTSSNALALGTGYVRPAEMIRMGLYFDLVGVVLISLAATLVLA